MLAKPSAARLIALLLKLAALCLLALVIFPASELWAKPTTADEARLVVDTWRTKEARPLGAILGEKVKNVQTFTDETGNPLYHVVYLNPSGFVIVPGDDLVEPIIGFLDQGTYDPSPANPLGALVSRDVPGRVLTARDLEKQAPAQGREFLPKGRERAAQRKWDRLKEAGTGGQASSQDFGITHIPDVRVSPIVVSTWDQLTAGGSNCYNYYTPKHYYCGCVATAMSQLMRFWQHPTSGVGTASFQITVDGDTQYESLRGGDGAGGPYDWGNMVLWPYASTTQLQRQAIGALTHDAGVSVKMDYKPGGASADTLQAADALLNTFMYANAKKGFNSGFNLPAAQRDNMVNPNLDASYPVLLSISSPDGGHAIVCDGYGFDSSTEYHHLNMGWSGQDNAWYNLPAIDTTNFNFNSVKGCIYNVYVTGSGEIISGRVLNDANYPAPHVTVTATRSNGDTYTTTTNDLGIYALAKVPSASTYTIAATSSNYTFNSQVVSTGTSYNNSITTGNLWGIDLVAGDSHISLNYALDNSHLAFTTNGAAPWFPESATFYYGGYAAQSGHISDNLYSTLQTTVVGPGTFSFHWKVSSQALGDSLEFYVDDALNDEISGEVDWHLKTYAIPAGSHTVKWVFSKDAYNRVGSDCGWVDKVVFTQSPALSVSPANLSPMCYQGQNAPSESFKVQNTGGGIMPYSITKSAAWLSVTPTSGTSVGEQDTITVNYATSSLAVGTYTGTITITAAGAIGSPKTIPITLTVYKTPPPIGSQTITATAGTNGAISPSGAVSVNYGANQTVTITPDPGYQVADVLVDGVSKGAITTFTFTNVTANHTIAASFAINPPHTITATAGLHGSISPAGAVSVKDAGSQGFTIKPDTNYQIKQVLVDGVSKGAVTSYTFTNVTGDHTIAVTFGATTVSILTEKDRVTVPPGKTAPLQVKLSDEPPANVVVTIAWLSGSPALRIKGVATLTFTTANWNTYQTVRIAATQDTNDMNATAVFDLSAPGQTGKQVTAIKGQTGGISPILLLLLE